MELENVILSIYNVNESVQPRLTLNCQEDENNDLDHNKEKYREILKMLRLFLNCLTVTLFLERFDLVN